METIIEKICREHGTLLKVKKNTVIFRADYKMDTPYVYYLVDGICALTGNSYHGQEQVLLYFSEGSLMGFNQFLGGFGSNFFSYSTPTGVTKTNCTIYRIPVAVFREMLDANLEFNKYIINVLSKHYHLTLAHLKQVQEDNTITVVCRFLLSMCEKKKEGMVLPKFFTCSEISQFLGVHVVTVGKIIAKLQREGYIQRISSGLLITREEALKDLVVNCETFKY